MRKSGRQSPVCCQATNDPVNNIPARGATSLVISGVGFDLRGSSPRVRATLLNLSTLWFQPRYIPCLSGAFGRHFGACWERAGASPRVRGAFLDCREIVPRVAVVAARWHAVIMSSWAGVFAPPGCFGADLLAFCTTAVYPGSFRGSVFRRSSRFRSSSVVFCARRSQFLQHYDQYFFPQTYAFSDSHLFTEPVRYFAGEFCDPV